MSIGKINSIDTINRDTPLVETNRDNLVRPRTAEGTKRDNKQLMDASKMYEHHFLQEMVKAMRSTVQESDLNSGGIGDKIYKDQLDDKYVESWSDQGGIGLANMIYDDMMEKYINRYRGDD